MGKFAERNRNNDYAVKHGIYAQFRPPVAGQQDEELYNSLIANLQKQFKPKTFTDELTLMRLAFYQLKWHRVVRYYQTLEKQYVDKESEILKTADLSTFQGRQLLSNTILSRFHDINRNEFFKRVHAEEKHICKQIETLTNELKSCKIKVE